MERGSRNRKGCVNYSFRGCGLCKFLGGKYFGGEGCQAGRIEVMVYMAVVVGVMVEVAMSIVVVVEEEVGVTIV